MKIIRLFFVLALPVFILSCKVQQKIPKYLQNVTDSTRNDSLPFLELRIQKNDILSIQVYSASIRPEIDAPYNLPAVSGSASGQAVPPGILVDAGGNIQYPRLGTIHAEGLTRQELAAVIRNKLIEPIKLLEDPTVIVRFQGLKITILGEVNEQGLINIPGEKVTILEAIGLSGGLTDYALKTVRVIRENDGKREIGSVDLASKELFESPYYNLVQNDVILVDPTPKKAKKADADMTLQRIGFVLSALTALGLLYGIFR
jgi:polysaccharide biosynthesis/export protein